MISHGSSGRRALVLLLALLLPVLAHAGSKRRDLIVWGLTMGTDAKGQEAVNREFERRHPDVRVKLLSVGAGSMDPQKLMTSIVGNVAPDVINQDRFSITDWASKRAFLPLDDFIRRDKGVDPNCPSPEKYYPAAWREAMFQGKVYGIPTGADNRALYYNKAIFRESADKLRAAGCDPNRPPRTWSELLRYGRALTEWNPDGSLKRIGFAPNYGNAWLYMYAYQNGGDFMSPDMRRCTLMSPETEEALRFMVQGYDALKRDPNSSGVGYELAKSFQSGFLSNENDSFLVGKIAMKIDGSWIIANQLGRYGSSLEFGVAPPPVPDERYRHAGRFEDVQTYTTWISGFALAIPRGARHVQDAWEYIKFSTSTEGRLIQARSQSGWERSRGRTYIPPVSSSREANEVSHALFRPTDARFAEALRVHTELLPSARIRPPTMAGQILWNEHTRALEAACYHRATPQEALLASQAVVQRDLDAFYTRGRYPLLDLSALARVGLALMGITLVGFAIWFARLRLGRLERGDARWGYAFISPWLFGFVVLTVGPMLASLLFSFTQYDVLNEARWIGVKNYADMFGSDRTRILKAFGNAGYLAAVGVPLGLTSGLAVALLLNTATRGMRFYRTVFYLPAVVPTIASTVLWTWVLTPDPNKGLINAYWVQSLTPWLGIAPPAWLESADWAKNALVVHGVWGAGSGMLLWLAGLKGVSSTLYEAAGIDGANPRQQFWKITFPQLSPIIFFNAVMGFIGAMQEFDRSYAMKPSSDGPIGPDDSMLTPVYVLFQNGFAFFKMGYASAVAWVIFAVILTLTAIQFIAAKRWVYYEVDR